MSIDPELSRLYRAGASEEPPRSLDDAILAAARREPPRAAAGPRPRAFLASLNWQTPFALAAVLVLTVSLVLVSGDEAGQSPALLAPDAGPFDPGSSHGVSRSPAPGASRPPEGASPGLPAEGVPPGPPPEAPSRELRRDRPAAEQAPALSGPSASSAPRPAPDRAPLRPQREGGAERVLPAAPVPPPAAQLPSHLEKEGASIAMPEELAPPQPARAIGKLRTGPRAEADAAEPSGRAKRESESANAEPGLKGPRPAPVQASPALPASQAAQSAAVAADESKTASPEELLREIEQLRRDGRLDEARDRLEAFRRRFPAYPLPPALQ